MLSELPDEPWDRLWPEVPAPASESVLAAMASAGRAGGNPSSIHRLGQLARASVEQAEERVRALLQLTRGGMQWAGAGVDGDALAIEASVAARRGPRGGSALLLGPPARWRAALSMLCTLRPGSRAWSTAAGPVGSADDAHQPGRNALSTPSSWWTPIDCSGAAQPGAQHDVCLWQDEELSGSRPAAASSLAKPWGSPAALLPPGAPPTVAGLLAQVDCLAFDAFDPRTGKLCALGGAMLHHQPSPAVGAANAAVRHARAAGGGRQAAAVLAREAEGAETTSRSQPADRRAGTGTPSPVRPHVHCALGAFGTGYAAEPWRPDSSLASLCDSLSLPSTAVGGPDGLTALITLAGEGPEMNLGTVPKELVVGMGQAASDLSEGGLAILKARRERLLSIFAADGHRPPTRPQSDLLGLWVQDVPELGHATPRIAKCLAARCNLTAVSLGARPARRLLRFLLQPNDAPELVARQERALASSLRTHPPEELRIEDGHGTEKTHRGGHERRGRLVGRRCFVGGGRPRGHRRVDADPSAASQEQPRLLHAR